jgi:hypothetical protein
VTFHPRIPPLPASGSKSAGGRYQPARPGWNQSGRHPRLSAGCPEPVGPTLGGCPLGCSPSRMPVDCPGGGGDGKVKARAEEAGTRAAQEAGLFCLSHLDIRHISYSLSPFALLPSFLSAFAFFVPGIAALLSPICRVCTLLASYMSRILVA